MIYWVANNTITFAQQYTIMRSQGVQPNVLGNILGAAEEAPRRRARPVAARVSHLWRHPIKGHGVEAVAAVTLAAGATMPWDRVWAIAHEAARVAPGAGDWAPCANFSRGAKSPELMAIRAEVDEARRPRHPDPSAARAAHRRSRRCRGRGAARRLGDAARPTPAGRSRPSWCAPSRGMTDSAFPSVSILNRASLAALGARLGTAAGHGALPRQPLAATGSSPSPSSTSSAATSGSAARTCGCASASPAARRPPSIPPPGVSDADTLGGAPRRLGPPGLRGLCRGDRRRPGRASATRGRGVKQVFTVAPEPDAEAAERGPQALCRPLRLREGRRRHGRRCRRRTGWRSASPGAPTSASRRLINALTGRKALARASNTPGRTQEINFFALGDRRTISSTCPATASPRRRSRWSSAGRRCCAPTSPGAPTLRRAFLLVDARHGIKAVDAEIMQLLDRSAVTFQAVLTKADKLAPAALAATVAGVAGDLGAPPGGVPRDPRDLGRDRPRPPRAALGRGRPG